MKQGNPPKLIHHDLNVRYALTIKMNNELVFALMATFGSVFAGLQLWQIKRISDLCERVTRMETEIEHHFNGKHDEPKSRRFP